MSMFDMLMSLSPDGDMDSEKVDANEGLESPKDELVETTKSYLEKAEGLKGTTYVPKINGKVSGNSGVTIANGLDLGQNGNDKYLKSLGFLDKTIKKLKPFYGLKKDKAVKKLKKTGAVTIGKDELKNVAQNLAKKSLDSAKSVFLDKGGDWDTLSTFRKVAFTSLVHQYGENAVKGWGLTKNIVNGEWEKAIKNIRNDFDDEHTSRRAETAAMLDDKKWTESNKYKAIKKNKAKPKIIAKRPKPVVPKASISKELKADNSSKVQPVDKSLESRYINGMNPPSPISEDSTRGQLPRL